jgi:HSP20 family protein
MNALIKNTNGYPNLVNTFFNKDLMDELFAPAHIGSAPAVNVAESAEGYRIEVAAPGLQKSDFKLNLDHKRLTISAQKENKAEEKNEKYTRREFSYASFQRTFSLPTTVDGEKINATYVDGVLLVELPKREEAKVKPARTIEIA